MFKQSRPTTPHFSQQANGLASRHPSIKGCSINPICLSNLAFGQATRNRLNGTFSNFEGPERRKIGELARTAGAAPPAGVTAGAEPPGFDRARADRALPVVRMLLGLKGESDA